MLFYLFGAIVKCACFIKGQQMTCLKGKSDHMLQKDKKTLKERKSDHMLQKDKKTLSTFSLESARISFRYTPVFLESLHKGMYLSSP